MNHWLLRRVIALPPFKGKHRLVSYARSRVMSPFYCKVSHGLTMELDCYEWTQLYLAEFGTTEPHTMALIEKLLQPGATFIDVGAHVGYVTLVARSLVGQTGKVIAIEPQPYNCERMLRNWERNGFNNLELHVAAAGDEPGFARIPQQSRTDKARLSLSNKMHDALALQYEVPLTTLDLTIEKHNIESIAVVKIDVEGHEAAVLRGLSKNLGRVKNILFEALTETEQDIEKTTTVCNWLRDRKFDISTVNGKPWDGSLNIPENNLWASHAV